MKKSTGILILLSFFVIILVLVGLFVALVVFLMQGSTPNFIGSSKRVALVRVEGVIYDAEDWIDQIEEYQEDSSVRAIVLRVDSPGGAVGPSQDLYNAVLEAGRKKVVVSSFASVAASGGYYVACGSSRIISAPGTLTGSIGVYSKFLQAKDLMEKIGIQYETVKAGKYKDFGSMDRELTPEEREMMQGVIDDTYHQFVEAVMKGRKENLRRLLHEWDEEDYIANHPYRNIDSEDNYYPFTEDVRRIIKGFQSKKERYEARFAREDIEDSTQTMDESKTLEPDEKTLLSLARALAEGKIYTGRQAGEIGLVDKIGSLDDAIDLAADLAGIQGEPTVVEKKERELSWLDLLTQSLVKAIMDRQSNSPLQYRFSY